MGEEELADSDGVVITHDGGRHHLSPFHTLTFGRAAACTVCLDPQDRGISRLAGSVEHSAGTWWLSNRSAVRALTMVDDLGIRTVVAPGRRVAITGPATIVVEGTSKRHALEIRTERDTQVDVGESGAALADGDAMPTAAAGEVAISDLDRLAMAALFAGYLESFPRYDPHPKTYADAAALLGWPRSTVVKRIEYIRTRLTNAGVPNLLGDNALDHLAEWALTTGVVTRTDLDRIKAP